MKNNKINFTSLVMAIVAIAVMVVSCKKENGNTLNPKAQDNTLAFDYRQIEDKVAYFTDFKKRIKESKDNESFNLNDAAWHLACLANMDFCNINVKHNDFLFDTIDMIVEIVDGSMQLNGLGAAYEQMRTKIHQFKNEFKHRDQNLYFINVSVGDDGNAKIALMTSFTSVAKDLIDHTWYVDDEWDAQYNCDEYFSGDSVYVWNSLAASELQRVLNLFENHSNESVTIFVPTRNHTFDYTNTYDQYGTPNYYLNNSRVFAKSFGNFNTSYNLGLMEMCYCLDSYLGLGYDYISDHLYVREHPVSWTVNSAITILNNTKYNYHQLHVQYGQITSITPPSPYDK